MVIYRSTLYYLENNPINYILYHINLYSTYGKKNNDFVYYRTPNRITEDNISSTEYIATA